MPTRVDTIRAAVMSVVTSALSVLVLTQIVSLNADQVAGITLLINNITLLAALLIPAGGTPAAKHGAEKLVE